MPVPLVFVSHSAKDPEAVRASRRVLKALEAANMKPLIDEREIELGDEWRRKVFHMVLECHAAVILLSADALSSKWVVFETAALALRKHVDPGLLVIPLLLASVSRANVEASQLSPIDLNKLEQVSGRELGASLRRITSRLRPLCAQLADTPLQALAQQITWWLPPERAVLAQAAAAIEVPAEEIELAPDPRPRLARALLDADLSSLEAAFRVLAPNVKRDGDAERLLDVISCTWVDPSAAEPIPLVLREPHDSRTVALNGTKRFTAYSYLQRAASRYPSWPTLPTANVGGEDQEGALIADIRKAYTRSDPVAQR